MSGTSPLAVIQGNLECFHTDKTPRSSTYRTFSLRMDFATLDESGIAVKANAGVSKSSGYNSVHSNKMGARAIQVITLDSNRK